MAATNRELALAAGLALRKLDHTPFLERRQNPVLHLAARLINGELSWEARQLSPSPLVSYWRARIFNLQRRPADCERELLNAQNLAPYSKEFEQLLLLEHARLASFRYRIRDARELLQQLFESPDLLPELALQCRAFELDIYQVQHSRGKGNLDAEAALHELSNLRHEARRLGLTRLFQQELRLRRLRLLARIKDWKRLHEELCDTPSTRLPKFHRWELQTLRLRGMLNLQPRKGRQIRKLLVRQLSSRPANDVPGLLRRKDLTKDASSFNCITKEKELDLCSDSIKQLLRLDLPADGLDLIQRELLGHGDPLFLWAVELFLETETVPEAAQIQRILSWMSQIENRHFVDVLNSPQQQQTMIQALCRKDQQRSLDSMRVHKSPRSVPGWHPSLDAVVSIKGSRFLHLLYHSSSTADWTHKQLPLSILDWQDLEVLGSCVQSWIPEDKTCYWIPDAATEQLPFWSLPTPDGLLGCTRRIVQCPNLGARHLGDQTQQERDTLWLKGHGEHDPKTPHLSRILPEKDDKPFPPIDIGDVMQQATGRKLVVLDVCHGGTLPGEKYENDLGLGLGALLGGAETVVCWSGRIPASDTIGPRGNWAQPFKQELKRGVSPREAARRASKVYVDSMSQIARPEQALEFLRVFGLPSILD